jgi:hypothetical protein
VHEAAEREWELFRQERTNGIADINQLRQRVADEEARRKAEKISGKDEMETDSGLGPPPPSEDIATADKAAEPATSTREVEMEVDDDADEKDERKDEKKEEPSSMQDDDDAVEY